MKLLTNQARWDCFLGLMCDIADTVDDGVAHDSKVAVHSPDRNSSQHAAGGFMRLTASAISSSAWRRTGASADGSRHVRICSGRRAGEQGDERVGGLAEMI